MRIALVWPPFNDPSLPPLGVARLVNALRRDGWSVDPIDLNIDLYQRARPLVSRHPRARERTFAHWSEDPGFRHAARSLAFSQLPADPRHDQKRDLLESCLTDAARILARDYALVGFSVTSTGLLAAAALSRMLRERAPRTAILWGGPCVAPGGEEALLGGHPSIDLLVTGEGEQALGEILRRMGDPLDPHVNGGGARVDRWGAGIPGVALRIGDEVRTEPPRLERTVSPGGADFTSFPLALYDLLTFPIQTAAGCSWGRCAFCSEPALSPGYRARPIGDVIAEIDELRARHGALRCYFVDDTLNSSPARLRELCRCMPPGVEWTGMLRARGLSAEMLVRLKAAGCTRIFLGMESLADRTLESMEKGTSRSELLSVLRSARRVGLAVHTNLITGFPGERVADLRACVDVLHRNAALWGPGRLRISPFVVTPGSTVHREPRRFGVRVLPWGDENWDLPPALRPAVPVWHHHWEPVEQRPGPEEAERVRLLRELRMLVRAIEASEPIAPPRPSESICADAVCEAAGRESGPVV